MTAVWTENGRIRNDFCVFVSILNCLDDERCQYSRFKTVTVFSQTCYSVFTNSHSVVTACFHMQFFHKLLIITHATNICNTYSSVFRGGGHTAMPPPRGVAKPLWLWGCVHWIARICYFYKIDRICLDALTTTNVATCDRISPYFARIFPVFKNFVCVWHPPHTPPPSSDAPAAAPLLGTSENIFDETLLKKGFQSYIFCSNVPSKCRKCRLRDPKFKQFPGGECPRIPLQLCRHYGLPLNNILATPLNT